VPAAPANPPAANPAITGPTTDPIAGPIRNNDTLTIVVVGEEKMSGQFRVDADGTITVPQLGRVRVARLMQNRAAEAIAKAIRDKRLLKQPDVSVYITGRPALSATVYGAISTPGRMVIKENTRLAEVIEPAGITPTSDLTKVVITRGDKEIPVNYQDFRTGKATGDAVNPVLQDEDRIFVYTRTPTEGSVRVLGGVKQAGQQVTVTTGTTVGQILQQAGGLTEDADREGIFIQRGGERIPVPYKDIEAGKVGADIPLEDKDVVNVPQLEKPKQFTISGAVNRPAQYPLRTRTTLLEAIAAASGPQDGARQNDVEIRRPAPDGTVVTRKYDLRKGEDAATTVESGDYIFVPYARRRQEINAFNILGALGSVWFLFRR